MRQGQVTIAWRATFSYVGPPVFIPDSPGVDVAGPTVFAPLSVSGTSGAVTNVVFRFDGAISNVAGSTTAGLDHTFVNDLQITLISPQGIIWAPHFADRALIWCRSAGQRGLWQHRAGVHRLPRRAAAGKPAG